MALFISKWYAKKRRRSIPKVLQIIAYTAQVNQILLLIITVKNPWYGM